MSENRRRGRQPWLYAVGLAAALAGGLAEAQMRITEGRFFGCFYANRGGQCSFDEADGTRHAIGLPSGEDSPVIWVIDGVEVDYVPMDGGFGVPDHPAFASDHQPQYGTSNHPLKGCPVQLIERPDETRLLIDTSDCGDADSD